MKAISLFSGAMGLDLGLEQAGIEIMCCVELDSSAVKTINNNRPDLPVIREDISTLKGNYILSKIGISDRSNINIVVGGPPCQAFSIIGRRKGIKDLRGKLVFEFLRIVEEINPEYFIMENVRGLHSMIVETENGKKSLYDMLIEKIISIGYVVDTFFVNAVNYGAPQIRERIIMIGNRLNKKAEFPSPTHSDKPNENQKYFRNLGDVLIDFKDPDSDIMDFSERKKNTYHMFQREAIGAACQLIFKRNPWVNLGI
jgi:DNA (cytosine-5)-methyltransferase 1